MKRIIAVIALLTAAVAAYAQEVRPGAMEQVRGRLCIDGTELTSAQVLELVGQEIFSETYEGAVKQYDAGRKLLISGAAIGGASLAAMLVGVVSPESENAVKSVTGVQ